MTVQYWLMKSEPDVFSLEDLKKKGPSHWDGVRNYQARNFMKQMKTGDLVIFYHSNANPSCAAGLARVVREAYPDFTSWDKSSDYFDPRSTQEKPLWMMVDVKYEETFKRCVSLAEIKANPAFKGLLLITRGRLSVIPVSKEHFDIIHRMAAS